MVTAVLAAVVTVMFCALVVVAATLLIGAWERSRPARVAAVARGGSGAHRNQGVELMIARWGDRAPGILVGNEERP